ncbi:MAG: vancomycin high temperature exclusion protein [Blastocatellales bacterium]
MVQRLRRLRWKPAWLCLLILLTTVLINLWITQSAKPRIYDDASKVPANDVGLLLGSSARVGRGHVNPHFRNRAEAAARLYHEGKVKHLLLSGDNHIASYDEPTDMKDALLELGVPRSAMTLDYAGFRTLDSIARAKSVFGLNRLTIITDDFHSQRALFLSRSYGVDAVAFRSEPVPLEYSATTRMREWLARVKAFLDVYALRTQPRFYGPRVEIIIEPYHS